MFAPAEERSSTAATARGGLTRSGGRSLDAGGAAPVEAGLSRNAAMEMKRLSGGNLRAAGYDDRNRRLVVELTAGGFCGRGGVPGKPRGAPRRGGPGGFFSPAIDEGDPAHSGRPAS